MSRIRDDGEEEPVSLTGKPAVRNESPIATAELKQVIGRFLRRLAAA